MVHSTVLSAEQRTKEKADSDSKACANEIVKISNEADRLKMANETLNRDKSVLGDEAKSLKMELTKDDISDKIS